MSEYLNSLCEHVPVKNVEQHTSNKISRGRVGSIDSFARRLRLTTRRVEVCLHTTSWPFEGAILILLCTGREEESVSEFFSIGNVDIFGRTKRTRGGEEERELSQMWLVALDSSDSWPGRVVPTELRNRMSRLMARICQCKAYITSTVTQCRIIHGDTTDRSTAADSQTETKTMTFVEITILDIFLCKSRLRGTWTDPTEIVCIFSFRSIHLIVSPLGARSTHSEQNGWGKPCQRARRCNR